MLDESLAWVLCETAEQMFFQEFQDTGVDEAPARTFWAKIAVRSPRQFEVIVAAEENQMRGIVELVFMDAAPTNGRIGDVVAELANTIAGSLSRHISEEMALELSPPEKGLGETPRADQYHRFSGEDLVVYVAIRGLDEMS